MTSARIFLTLGLVLFLALLVFALLIYTPLAVIPSFDAAPFVLLGVGALSFISLLVGLILIQVDTKARKKEEEKLKKNILSASSGEKSLLEEGGEYFGEIATSINHARLLKEKVDYKFGLYKEERFDEIVLKTLENEVTSKAGLAYFILQAENPIKTHGPRDALLTMLKGHFGEKLYYGRLDNGIALFMPILPSKEDFLGRVKRTVQLYSYSEGTTRISSKAGVAFYPDFAPRLLTAEALKATLKQLALDVHSKDEVVPYLGYNAAEKEAFLLHKENFKEALMKASTLEELDKAYHDYALSSYPYLSCDSLGIALYKQRENAYMILDEIGESGSRLKPIEENGLLSIDTISPILDWSREEKGVAIANDIIFLNDKVSSVLENAGATSIACLGLSQGETPIALIYCLSSEKEKFANNKAVIEYLDTTREYLYARSALEERRDNAIRQEAILSSFGHYSYGVSKDSYNLSFVSTNLSKAVPEAKVGKLCYEALFGLKKPCEHCPLIENDVEKVMPRLASGVFAYKAVKGEEETLLILSSHKADFSPTRLDPYTGLLSDKSLHEDLQSEILLKDSTGIILSFRVRNLDAIDRLLRLNNYEEVMKGVSDALSSSGLSRGLYRYGNNCFAYLLPFAKKEEGRALAEKIGRVFANKIFFKDREVEFIFDYALLSYPLEAETPFALDAILRILYQKADATSRGRLFEINNEKGRLVDLDYYMKTKLEEGLRAKRLPVAYSPYVELHGKNVAFLEASVTLDDEAGEMIPKERIEEACKVLDKDREVALASIATISRFLGEKRKEIASKPIQGVIVNVPLNCIDEEFMDAVEKLLNNNKASKSQLFIQTELPKEGAIDAASKVSIVKRRGIRVGLRNYDPNFTNVMLADIYYVMVPAKLVYGEKRKSFLLSMSKVRKARTNVLVEGYRDNEEKRYLGSLTFHYGKKADQTPIREKEVTF